MEIEQVCKLFAIIIGVCAALGGMLFGFAIGYFAGRRNRRSTWNWDALKRSDHFHHERKDRKL